MGYFRNVADGLAWMGGLRGITRVVSFLRIAILARILTPLHFGLFGIASLVLSFLEIVTETGINVFFIQKEGELKDYLNSAWLASILRGFFIALSIFVLAPFISSFFNSPDAQGIIRLIALVPLIRGFINPAIVKYQMDLSFDKEFWMRFLIFVFDSMVVVVFGLLTRSPYSFVWGLIAGAVFETGFSLILIKPKPAISLDVAKLKRVLDRGKWVTAYGFFNYAFENGDDIVVGRLFNANTLGVYQLAYKISSLPISEIAEIFIKVTFPVYSKISGDMTRLKTAYLKTLFVVSVLVIPLSIFVYLFPKEIVLILAGDQWLGAVEIVKVLALFGAVRAVTHPAYALFLAIKKQELVTISTSANFFIMIALILPLTLRFGIIGAAYSALMASLLTAPFVFFYVYKIFRKA